MLFIWHAKATAPRASAKKVSWIQQDKVKDLCKVNSLQLFAPCRLKVGDKFYYIISPQRPADDTVVQTFYEDAGIAPTRFTPLKPGDTLFA